MSDQLEEVATPFTPETPVAPVQDPVPVVATSAPVFQVPDAARDLVGEGKKYSTPEDALNALPHAQSHIVRIEEEMATLRETLASRDSASEVLEAINNNTPEKETVPQFDPNQLDALIESKMSAKETAATEKVKSDSVANRFVAEYGDEKAEQIYVQKAQELGLTVDYMNNLAKTSPDAVFKLCGLNPTTSTPSKITSNVNSEAVYTQAPAPVERKSVMGGSTLKADVAAWNAAKPTE